MMNERKVIIAKGITFRGTGVRFQPPPDPPRLSGERKVYIINGANYIPSPSPQISPEKPPLLEVKAEPPEDEEYAEGKSNSYLPEQLHIKEEEPEFPEQPSSNSATAISISTSKPICLKRTSECISKKHDTFENDELAPILEPEQPPEKTPRHGCRCDHILPQLEKRMEWMMGKMLGIESMTNVILRSSQDRETALRVQLLNATNEIAVLRSALILERNPKGKSSERTRFPPSHNTNQ